MSEKTSLECTGSVLVRRMQEFLSLPSTNTTAAYRDHWDSLTPSIYRSVEIQDYEFLNATRITCVAKEAYKLFSDFLNSNCHNVFRNWEGEEFDVEFWIIDNPSV
jgi:hypothetical protein